VIENTALRAIIAGAVGIVVWWLLNMLLHAMPLLFWPYLWAIFLLAVGVAVWAFIGLGKPGRRSQAPHA
jgi:hypothetical protein